MVSQECVLEGWDGGVWAYNGELLGRDPLDGFWEYDLDVLF